MDRPLPAPTAASTAALLLACLGLGSCSATTSSASHSPHPHRPKISVDTYTTPEDAVELEAGFEIDPRERFALPARIRYGLAPRTELFVGVVPYLSVDQGPIDETGLGDSLVGVRHRLAEETDERPAGALQIAAKLPTASESKGLGSGEVDLLLAGILDKQVGEYGLTGFYQLGILGEVASSGTDLQHTFAVAATRAAGLDWTGFGELAFLWTPERDDEQLFATGGVYHHLSRELTLDFGLRLGLTSDAPDLALLVGLAYSLGNLHTGGHR